LKGVHIGCHSVIGLGSVVTRSIPKNSIAVGIPAVVKQQNISWVRENIF
jgi:acetyltransferase-like isoleucine patch superfamily enzyme